MIPLVVIGGWLMVLAVAAIYGLSGRINRLEGRLVDERRAAAAADARSSRLEHRLEEALVFIDSTRDGRFQEIDGFLGGLPIPDKRKERWTIHCLKEPMGPRCLASDLAKDMTTPLEVIIDRIDLNLTAFCYRGEGRVWAWKRNGWLLIPDPNGRRA